MIVYFDEEENLTIESQSYVENIALKVWKKENEGVHNNYDKLIIIFHPAFS